MQRSLRNDKFKDRFVLCRMQLALRDSQQAGHHGAASRGLKDLANGMRVKTVK